MLRGGPGDSYIQADGKWMSRNKAIITVWLVAMAKLIKELTSIYSISEKHYKTCNVKYLSDHSCPQRENESELPVCTMKSWAAELGFPPPSTATSAANLKGNSSSLCQGEALQQQFPKGHQNHLSNTNTLSVLKDYFMASAQPTGDSPGIGTDHCELQDFIKHWKTSN